MNTTGLVSVGSHRSSCRVDCLVQRLNSSASGDDRVEGGARRNDSRGDEIDRIMIMSAIDAIIGAAGAGDAVRAGVPPPREDEATGRTSVRSFLHRRP